MASPVVRVGVGVFIVRGSRVLIGKRMGSHGEGTYQLPGGHLEFGETWEQCAVREAAEETGLNLTNVTFETATNDIMEKDKKHYVTIFMRGVAEGDQEPQLLEPDKCAEWKWMTLEEIPRPRFMPLEHVLTGGYSPFR